MAPSGLKTRYRLLTPVWLGSDGNFVHLAKEVIVTQCRYIYKYIYIFMSKAIFVNAGSRLFAFYNTQTKLYYNLCPVTRINNIVIQGSPLVYQGPVYVDLRVGI